MEVGASDHLSFDGRRLLLPSGMSVAETSTDSDVTLSLGGYMPAVTTALGAQYYDRVSNIYGMRPDRYRRTRAKLAAAKAGLGLCKIACVGDSTTEGRQSSGRSTASYPIRLQKMLSDLGYPIAGDGMILPGKAGISQDERWTSIGTWTFQINAANPPNGEFLGPHDTTSALVCSPILPFTAFDVYGNDTGAFQYSTDGGSTWTNVAAGSLGSTLSKKLTVTGLTNATRTIQIKNTTAANIMGIACYAASGITVSNFGCSGLLSASWIDTATTFYTLVNVLTKFAPDVIVYNIGINDGLNGPVAGATLQANIAAFAAMFPNADIFLAVPVPISDSTSGRYHQDIYTVADSLGIAVLDLFDRWGSYATANTYGLESGDGTHPGDAGYADMAYAARGLFVP
jgi:lysophospholipase L1-like esterase